MIADWISSSDPWIVVEGDSEHVPLPTNSFDALICDPPAGISFMGKAWDGDKGGSEQWIAWLSRCLRRAFDALKPGGYAVVWSLPRTSHWTGMAIERAGFEVVDSIHHSFATGFPKGMNISKAIDARAGAERAVVGPVAIARGACHGTQALGGGWQADPMITAPATPEAKRWHGYSTTLKPAHETWWVARKPLEGTYVDNVLKHGCGAINIDAGRVFTDWSDRSDAWKRSGNSAKPDAEKIAAPPGQGIVCHPAGRWPANVVNSHASWDESSCSCGWSAPTLAKFCQDCGGPAEQRREGCRCVGERTVISRRPGGHGTKRPQGLCYGGHSLNIASSPTTLREGTMFMGEEDVPTWECLAACDACGSAWLTPSGGPAPACSCGGTSRWACPVAMLDAQSGERPSGASHAAGVRAGLGYMGASGDGGPAIEPSSGGASRFFHAFAPDPWEPFVYSAKPSTREREAGTKDLKLPGAARGNTHPTVKSLALIGHFCDLFLPPGGVALDLFGGSGTLAAVVAQRHAETGWRAALVELDPHHCAIARARAEHWGSAKKPKRAPAAEKAVAAPDDGLVKKRSKVSAGQLSLFNT